MKVSVVGIPHPAINLKYFEVSPGDQRAPVHPFVFVSLHFSISSFLSCSLSGGDHDHLLPLERILIVEPSLETLSLSLSLFVSLSLCLVKLSREFLVLGPARAVLQSRKAIENK